MESKRFFAKHPGGGQTKFKGLSKIFRGAKAFQGMEKSFWGPVVESQTLSQTSRLNLDKFGVDNYIPDCQSAPFALTIGPLA